MKLWGALLCTAFACGPSARDHVIDAAIEDAAYDDAPASIAPEPDATPAGPVDVVITADNAYSFGYGDVNGITSFTQGTRALTAAEIFSCPIGVGPEEYTVPAADAPAGAYLYIASWDDHEVTQGMIAQFSRNTGTVTTGSAPFDVCATGIDYATGSDDMTGPTQAIINQQIAMCNAGSGDPSTTSVGWVNATGPTTPNAIGTLAVGPPNDSTDTIFQIACQPTATTNGIGSDARWLWYDPSGLGSGAFYSNGTNFTKSFLIFRLAAETIF
jgi:hypothetical protein